MFNSIASLFFVLTIGSIPGQVMVLIVVALFHKTKLGSIDAKAKKFLLLSSYFLVIIPIFYLIASYFVSLSGASNYAPSQFSDIYYNSNIANTMIRNEWLFPLSIIWLSGVFFNLFRSKRRLMDFRDRVMLEGTQCSIHELDFDCSELPVQIIKYLSDMTIIKHPAAQSPLVFGYRKKFLIIPDQKLTQKQLHMIIHHEMTHLIHKDLWTKLMAEIIRLFFFYNLVFISASRFLDEICEQLCDSVVTADMSTAEKKEYGYLLLNMLEQAEPGNKMTQAALSKDKKQLKTRLQAIVHPAKVSFIRQGIIVIISAIVITLLFATVAIIIPEANKWDQNRQLFSTYRVEQEIASSISPDYEINDNFDSEMTHPEPSEN